MRKTIVLILIFIIILLIGEMRAYAVTPTLEQIAEAFNNYSTVKEYVSLGSIWKATSNNNKLNIEVSSGESSTKLEYTLNGTILSGTFAGDDALTGALASSFLIDSIGTLQGYSEGDLMSTLNSEAIKEYTVENEGCMISQESSEEISIKVDISKKIPLADLSNVYFTVDDLKSLETFIAGDGSAEKSKGNIWFNKSGYDGENTLLVAEKDALTENTYKSILSIIEVMFNSNKASEYFKSNYSAITIGNKEFNGIKVEVNPTKNDFEEGLIPSDSNYQFVRISINKNDVNNELNKNEIQKNNNDSKDDKTKNQNVTETEIPHAGIGINTYYIIFTLIAFGIVLGLKIKNMDFHC